MQLIRVGQQVFRLEGIIRAVWRGSKLVVVFGDGYTSLEGEVADHVWRELLRHVEERSSASVDQPCGGVG